jgi:phosphoribosylanthranilate isomerase
MKIKVCGLTDVAQMMALADNFDSESTPHAEEEKILQIQEKYSGKVDFIGINFYAISPRYYKGEVLVNLNMGRTKKVGIFVNADADAVIKTIKLHGLDYVQLHGDEPPAYCAMIAKHAIIIKAFPHYVLNERSLLLKYKMCELFLFDTASLNYGGSGKKFDWAMLKDYKGPRPFLLAGGISLDDVNYILTLKHQNGFLGIDINSKFEVSPGIKDLAKINSFIKTLRNG